MTSERRKPGPGRPRFADGEARTRIFNLRVTEAEHDAIVAAAERDGKSVTQWAREVLLAAAPLGR